jgi:hypothetical protein
MKAKAIDFTDLAILERLIVPRKPNLPPDVAHYLLGLRFSKSDQDRMHELAEKARHGTLTRSELDQIEVFERVNHLVSLLQSKARRSLRRATTAS